MCFVFSLPTIDFYVGDFSCAWTYRCIKNLCRVYWAYREWEQEGGRESEREREGGGRGETDIQTYRQRQRDRERGGRGGGGGRGSDSFSEEVVSSNALLFKFLIQSFSTQKDDFVLVRELSYT